MRSPRRPVMWEVLTNDHRFGIFFVGAALSNIGTWCQNLAAILLVYRLTESTMVVSLVTVAQFSAPVLLAPWAGLVADRYDRRHVLMATQLAGAVVSAGLAVATLTEHISATGALCTILLLGVCQAFQSPAQLSLTPLMTSADHRELGMSLNSSQFNLARAIGPIVANLIIVAWGIGEAFVFNTFTYFLYVIALRFVRPSRQERSVGRSRLRDTLGVVRAEPLIVPMLLVGLVISGSTDVVATLGPALSIEVTGDDGATGYLISAFGAGAVLTAFLLVPWLRRFPRRLAWTVVAQGVGVLVVAVAPGLTVAMIGFAVAGGAFLASSNRALTLVQGLVPAASLGRVMAIWILAFLGGRPLFALTEGLVDSVAGPRAAAAVVALTIFAAAAGVAITSRRLGPAAVPAGPVVTPTPREYS
ncbi:MAG: MFS transporter [Aeromicrobium sp.]